MAKSVKSEIAALKRQVATLKKKAVGQRAASSISGGGGTTHEAERISARAEKVAMEGNRYARKAAQTGELEYAEAAIERYLTAADTYREAGRITPRNPFMYFDEAGKVEEIARQMQAIYKP